MPDPTASVSSAGVSTGMTGVAGSAPRKRTSPMSYGLSTEPSYCGGTEIEPVAGETP